MRAHRSSSSDLAFRSDFEAGRVSPKDFDHRSHLRLAYGYLCEYPLEEAHRETRRSIISFLREAGVGGSKYHETMTRAWIIVVHHFMIRSAPCESADDFILRNPVLLDHRIMLTHYSRNLLFSDDARRRFLEPDLQPIPTE